MAEPNYRYRIPPCANYDIPAMESWLEDMAAKGLHLAYDGFFMGLAHFEEGPPRHERFRLEATTTNGGLMSEEYSPEGGAVQMNQQMGWAYRARRGQFHIYSCADPHAPELHTDPQIQAMTIETLGKHLRKALLSALVWIAFYMLFYFGDILVTASVVLGTWRVALFALLMLWKIARQFRELAAVNRYRRQLQAGTPIPHRSDYRRKGLRHLAWGALRRVLWIVLIAAVLAHMAPFVNDECYVQLDSCTDPFPFATLEDVYPGAQITRQDWMLHSHVYAWSDPLSPENYDFSEYAQVTHEGQTFDCYLTVQYHRTRWDWTARQLSREFVSQAGGSCFEQTLDKLFGQEPVIVTPLSLPEADYCVYYYDGLPDPYVILQKDHVVLRARYASLGEGPRLSPEELARIILSQIR